MTLFHSMQDPSKCKGDPTKLEIPVLPEEENANGTVRRGAGAGNSRSGGGRNVGGRSAGANNSITSTPTPLSSTTPTASARTRGEKQPQILVVNKSDLLNPRKKAGYGARFPTGIYTRGCH
jgi:hypothetical protein